MSFSNKSNAIAEESYFQCVDCGKSIIEKRDKKQCRTCGKILCNACHYSTFEICHQCRQDFENRSPEEKYGVMLKFKIALKAGPMLLQVLGSIFAISSIVLFTIFLINGATEAHFIFGILAASEFSLSLLLFWVASRIGKNKARGLQEVERRLADFKSQISPERTKQNRVYSTQYRQTSPKGNYEVEKQSKTLVFVNTPLKNWLIATITLSVFIGIAALTHLIIFLTSFDLYVFGIIGGVEVLVMILLILLSRRIKVKLNNR